MNPPRFDGLEVMVRTPAVPTAAPPLLFIHGAFTAAWCWAEHFLDFFAEEGFNCYAVSLSGHGGSRAKGSLDSLSIADYVADVARVAGELPVPPVLIGHSMGGFVAQKYLEDHAAAGAVLMCSVPPQGLMSATFVKVLERCDVFRRPERFADILAACEADYRGRAGFAERPYPQADLWRRALAAARAVDAGGIAQSCTDPARIPERIHQARVKAVKEALA